MDRDAPSDVVERVFSTPRGCLGGALALMGVLALAGAGLGLLSHRFGVPWGPAVTVGVVVGVCAGGLLALMGALRAGAKQNEQFVDRLVRRRDRVLAMSWEEVRQRAEDILSRSYTCVPAASGRSGEDLPVGPVLRGLFGRFDRIEDNAGDFSIARQEVGPSELVQGLIRLGTADESGEVVVERGKDEVWVIDAESPRETGTRWPTVLHFMIYESLVDE